MYTEHTSIVNKDTENRTNVSTVTGVDDFDKNKHGAQGLGGVDKLSMRT